MKPRQMPGLFVDQENDSQMRRILHLADSHTSGTSREYFINSCRKVTQSKKLRPVTCPYSMKLERLLGVALGTSVFLISIPASRADVLIELVESGSDVIATANGSLNLPGSSTSTYCGTMAGQNPNGAIDPPIRAICVGPSGTGGFQYTINPGGTMSFGSQMGTSATSSSGTFFGVNGMQMLLGSSSGLAGTLTVNGQSIFSGKTLVGLGVLSPREVVGSSGVVKGIWTLANPSGGPVQTITLRATPGPLSLLGLPLGYGWSRTLRRRINAAEVQLPT